jgi:hypothetical protein
MDEAVEWVGRMPNPFGSETEVEIRRPELYGFGWRPDLQVQ